MRLHMMTALLLVAPWAGVAAAQDTTTQTQNRDTLSRQSNDYRMQGPQSDDAVLLKMHETNQLEVRLGQLAQRNSQSTRIKTFGNRLVRDHSSSDQKVTALAKKLGVSLARGQGQGMQGRDGYIRRDTTQGRDGYMRRDTTQRTDTTNRQPMDTTNRQGYPADTVGRMGRQGYPADTVGRMGRMGQEPMQGKGEDHEQLVRRLESLRGPAFDAAFANAMVDGHNKAISMLEQWQNRAQNSELRTLITSTLPTLRQHLQTAQSLSTGATSSSSIQQ